MNKNEKNCSTNKCSSKDHIKGICCNVKNCVHHDCETYCTAEQIAVGPSSATCSADTVCATFKERK
ncbi:MAG: DUF1540 domain-containing protein [Ruminococcaceae bacterium]|nr:DUF1540 domain-containing protein [Oscillospiraceae bacterium]